LGFILILLPSLINPLSANIWPADVNFVKRISVVSITIEELLLHTKLVLAFKSPFSTNTKLPFIAVFESKSDALNQLPLLDKYIPFSILLL